MLIRIISLFSSPLRKVVRSFEYSFFDAIDNISYVSDKKFNHQLFIKRYRKQPSKGEIGCALSHATLLTESSCDTTVRWTCVLEDDAMPEINFELFLKELSEIETEKPTIIILGYSKTKKSNFLIHKLKYPLYDKYCIGGYQVGKTFATLCGTVGYVANKAAADLFSDIDEVYWVADDWDMIATLGVDIHHVSTPLIYEDLDSPSTTGNVVHCANSFFSHPLGNLKIILLNQFKVCMVKANALKKLCQRQ
tara:strand:- start:10517 stop:11266 length:750 start_codon:yes stop_codon:yes gene_type:complete